MPIDTLVPPAKAGKDAHVHLNYLANIPLYDQVKPVQAVPGFLDKGHRSNIQLEQGPLEVRQCVFFFFSVLLPTPAACARLQQPKPVTHTPSCTGRPIIKTYRAKMLTRKPDNPRYSKPAERKAIRSGKQWLPIRPT